MKAEKWYIYILRCADGTLYTGVTTDIERRLVEHNHEKTGAKYTRTRRPVFLVYREVYSTRSEATKREAELKKFSRVKKQNLVSGL
jgi:putative endonuclease